ncbi:MAG: vWA domain-containing protein [Phycisphaeraceae bacterium]
MTEKHTDITMILDRSGSMHGMQGQVIESFNSFLAEQRDLDRPATFSLVQFNADVRSTIQTLPIDQIRDIDEQDYQPDGSTSLLDAIGGTIGHIRRRVKNLRNQPDVIVLVLTDGMENSSTQYSLKKIRGMITKAEERGWRFVFMAAGLDAFSQHVGLGLRKERSAQMRHTPESFRRGMHVLGRRMSVARESGNLADMDFLKQELAYIAEQEDKLEQEDKD